MAIPDSVIQDIKYRNDIESIISPYVNLKRRGKNLVGLCPFHNEKTPSFTVYPENGSFYCYGCGVGGDIFSFTRLIENLDYIDAVKLLAERSGITIQQDDYDDSMQRLRSTVYDINRDAAKFFHSYLMSERGKWALDYLMGRGLSVSTIKHFGLGAAPDSWDELLKFLKDKGYSISDMMQANVIGKSSRGTYYDRFRNRVMFPIINIRGRVVGFSGRARPDDDKAGGKYVNTSDTCVYKKSENLFAMNFAKNNCADRIILVEGNMDVISLHQAGFENTVAALGTAFTDEQAKIISRYTKEVVLTLDADAAGQKAIRRAGEVLKNTGLEVRVIVLPDGKDPDEFIKKHGKARFAALLEGAVSELEYKLLMAVEGIDVNSDDGKLQYLTKAAVILAGTNDSLARDLYIRKLSERYGISRTALETRVNQLRREAHKSRQKKEFKAVVTPKYTKDSLNPEKRDYLAAAIAEETVIAVLLQHPNFIEKAFEQLSPDQMVTSLNRRIYKIIWDVVNSGREVDTSCFGQSLSPAEMGYLVSLANSDRCDKKPDVVLKDSIKVILNEGTRKTAADIKNMSNEDWAEELERIIKNKRGNKNGEE